MLVFRRGLVYNEHGIAPKSYAFLLISGKKETNNEGKVAEDKQIGRFRAEASAQARPDEGFRRKLVLSLTEPSGRGCLLHRSLFRGGLLLPHRRRRLAEFRLPGQLYQAFPEQRLPDRLEEHPAVFLHRGAAGGGAAHPAGPDA